MILLCRYGEFMVPESNDLIANSLRNYGEWAQAEINVLSHFIDQGNVVVDAGSFIGTHARAFSSMVGRSGKVHAFEPNSLVIPYLKENAARSPFSNIVVHSFALGATYERQVLISEFDENQGSCRLAGCDYENNEQFVEVKSLDSCSVEKVDFIKADVEGMELALLKGAEKLIDTFKPVIFVEANSLEATCGVIKWAQQREYFVYGVITMTFNPENFNQIQDNIFGQAKECGLLLIHKKYKEKYIAIINMLNLPEIITADDLVLMMLHKPQYAYEILEKSRAASVLGIEYSSPILEKMASELAERDGQIASLNQAIAQRDGQIAAILSSRSWRITKPLRFFGRVVRCK